MSVSCGLEKEVAARLEVMPDHFSGNDLVQQRFFRP